MHCQSSVYVLESRHHGSNQQLHALASILAKGRVIKPLQCELRSRRPWVQFICRLAVKIKSVLEANSVLSRFIDWVFLSDAPGALMPTDIIIGKTPPFEWVAALLAAGSDAKIYYLGAPRRIPRSLIFKTISTPSTLAPNADYNLDTLPTSWKYQDIIAMRKASNIDSTSMLWILLVGGDARGYSYDYSFWSDLILFIRSSLSSGLSWQISTSPRSGQVVENLFHELEAEFGSERIVFYPWSDPIRRVLMLDLISKADAIFVTEESASMLSEACNSRLPVIALRPERPQYNSQVTPLIDHLQKLKVVRRKHPSELDVGLILNWNADGMLIIDHCWSDSILEFFPD